MDDDSLEDQINQTRHNLPARIPEIYGDRSRGENEGSDLRSAIAEPTPEDNSKSSQEQSGSKDRDRTYSRPNYTAANQARKLGRAVKEAALSANDLGRDNLNSASQELNAEAADVALAGTAGLIRGLKAGYAAHKDNQKNTRAAKGGEITPADPAAIEAFIASLPPPPKAIAAPLKRLLAPGRYSGPERD